MKHAQGPSFRGWSITSGGQRAFVFDFLRERIGRMYDDVEVLRHFEYTVASPKMQLSSWWQIYEATVAGKDPMSASARLRQDRLERDSSSSRWMSCGVMWCAMGWA